MTGRVRSQCRRTALDCTLGTGGDRELLPQGSSRRPLHFLEISTGWETLGTIQSPPAQSNHATGSWYTCTLHGRAGTLLHTHPSPSRVTYLAGPTRDHEGEWTIRSAPLVPRRSTGWCWLPWGVNTQHNFWQRWEDALARRPTILLCRHPSWEPAPPAFPSLAPTA